MGSGAWQANVGTWYFAAETVGQLNEKRLNVYLTDGGHIENLGIYELLRRRCKVILAVDAETDPDMTFPALVNLEVMARIDLGVRIELPWQALQASAIGVTGSALYGPAGAPGSHGPHAAIGTIRYGEKETGVLIYIKASLSGDENDYVLDYKRRNPTFPHESIVDQFFNEEQFEAYRALGFHATRGLLTGADDFSKPKAPSAGLEVGGQGGADTAQPAARQDHRDHGAYQLGSLPCCSRRLLRAHEEADPQVRDDNSARRSSTNAAG